jgi:3-oxoadipate enol-lactonase
MQSLKRVRDESAASAKSGVKAKSRHSKSVEIRQHVKMKTIKLAEVELAIDDRGAGRVLLFVHGFPLDHTMWQHQIEEFSRGYRAVAPDLRGFGQSSLGTGEVTMRRYADDLAVLLDRLSIKEPIIFCGLSMGGYIAWQFWQKYADRLAALVLCDTRAVADSPQARGARAQLAEKVRAVGSQAAADAMLPKLFARESGRHHPQWRNATREAILRNRPDGIIAALEGMAGRPDATEMLAAITVPTLVVVGEHDAISPPTEMRTIADRIPDAEFAVIKNAGHMSPLEEPAAFNEALARFLARISHDQ